MQQAINEAPEPADGRRAVGIRVPNRDSPSNLSPKVANFLTMTFCDKAGREMLFEPIG